MSYGSINARPFSILHDRADTMEVLVPAYDAPQRTVMEWAAVTSLMASLFGGGLLTYPYAYGIVGLYGGVVLQLVSALSSAYSIYMISTAARRTGDTSFTSLVRTVLGTTAEKLLTYMMMMDLTLVIAAYLILVRDIIKSVPWFGTLAHSANGANGVLSAFALGCSFPLSLNRTMPHAITPLSVVAIMVLVILVVYRGSCEAVANPSVVTSLKLWPSWSDLITAFPIYAFSYLCQFNALNVLASLHEPSRDKVKAVIYKTIAASTVIYVMFGIAGFIWATSKYDTVAGDILTQFASDDHVIMVGKVGLLVSLLLNVPLLVLPLRDLVIELGCCNLDGLEDGAEDDLLPSAEVEWAAASASAAAAAATLCSRDAAGD
mmetsp:Transcript_75000/g.213317  ORF Transcript_75000/g.213317 Transcript_75000/m.213317 type:complete len:376 (-) Transcript_75000:728-1855(-)